MAHAVAKRLHITAHLRGNASLCNCDTPGSLARLCVQRVFCTEEIKLTEMLDIVDEADQVIAQATREAVHQGQHLHRATHMLLRNSAGEVFVQLRSRSKDMHPGLWDTSAAGHVDAGESYIDCAVRELQEELGLQVDASELDEFMRVPPSSENGFEFVRVYLLQSDDKLTLEEQEIEEGRWVKTGKLDSWLAASPEDFTPDFHLIWQNARSRFNS